MYRGGSGRGSSSSSFRGGRGGGGGGGGYRGRGRGGGGGYYGGGNESRSHSGSPAPSGPPAELQGIAYFCLMSQCISICSLLVVGEFIHPCEGEMVCKSTISQVPYFNAPIYLENKTMIGKVDEILGPMNDFVRGHCIQK